MLDHGAQMLLHLGDIGNEAVIDALVVPAPESASAPSSRGTTGAGETPQQRQIEARIVFGNTDIEVGALTRYATSLGIVVDHPVGRVSLPGGGEEQVGGDAGADSGNVANGLRGGELVFCHGHESAPMRDAVRRGARYLCHGHTHEASDTRQGATRIINPGALHRARQYNVAVLCTESDTVTFYSVS